jgi:hypothetical protein
MNEAVSMALLQNVLNTQQNLIAIFKGAKLFLVNRAFLNFFRATSIEDFNSSFRSFTDSFVPHPSYFNRDKIVEEEHWYETIARYDEADRVVSMLTPTYEPHAFSVDVAESIEEYTVVTFVDVTQTLIKRIMIENNATLDMKSGAYDKKYFLHIAKNYEDAAVFNEKIIVIIKLTLLDENPSEETLQDFTQNIKEKIREDDMLVRWENNKFILVCLADNQEKANLIVSKVKSISGAKANLASIFQTQGEKISKLLSTLNDRD